MMDLHGTIPRVSEVISTFVGAELIEKGADLAPDGFFAAFGGLAEEMLELCEHLFDGVEVG
jgi:hypothetical protein